METTIAYWGYISHIYIYIYVGNWLVPSKRHGNFADFALPSWASQRTF